MYKRVAYFFEEPADSPIAGWYHAFKAANGKFEAAWGPYKSAAVAKAAASRRKGGKAIEWVKARPPAHDEDNARLVAAAPELLAALEYIAGGEGAYGWHAHEYKQIARAAIAKVRGE